MFSTTKYKHVRYELNGGSFHNIYIHQINMMYTLQLSYNFIYQLDTSLTVKLKRKEEKERREGGRGGEGGRKA